MTKRTTSPQITPKPNTSSSLRQRGGRLGDAAGRFLKRGLATQEADQPQSASLPEGSAVERGSNAVTDAAASRHPSARLDDATARTPAEGDAQPSQETTMGRHESFDTAVPLADALMSSNAVDRLFPGPNDGGRGQHSDAHVIALCKEAAREKSEAGSRLDADGELPNDAFARSYELLERATSTTPVTLGGLASKAKLLLTHVETDDELETDGRCCDLAMALARDVVRIAGLAATQDAPDATLLALAAKLLPMLDAVDRAWAVANPLYDAGVAAHGGFPDWEVVGMKAHKDWTNRWLESPEYNAYVEARRPADVLDGVIEAMVVPLMDLPARTLDGLLLKHRIARTLKHYGDEPAVVMTDLDKLLDARLTAGGFASTSMPARLPTDDTLFEAIAKHATAHCAFNDTTNASDDEWVRQHGGDASEAAMTSAVAVNDAAGKAADQAWRDLFGLRPTTALGFYALLNHARTWFDEYYHLDDAPDILAALAAGFEGLFLDGLMARVREDT